MFVKLKNIVLIMKTVHIVYNSSDVESSVCAAYVMAKSVMGVIDFELYDTCEHSENELRSCLNELAIDDDNTIFFAGWSWEKNVGSAAVFDVSVIRELSQIGNVVWCDNAPVALDDSEIGGFRDELMHKFMCVEVFFENTTGILPYNIHRQGKIINGTLLEIYNEVLGYIEEYKQ